MLAENYLIEIRDLSFTYDRRRPLLLRNIQFRLRPGQLLGIWGDNGSGKSTLIKLMLGYLAASEPGGRVLWEGKPANALNPLTGLGYVGDPGHSDLELGLPLGVLCGELLDTVAAIDGKPPETPAASYLSSVLEIARLRDRRIDQLSAGERKRLMLYLALRVKRKLLILDEPTEGLDFRIVDTVLEQLKQYLLDYNCALVLVSHRQEEVSYLTTHTYFLQDGGLTPMKHKRYKVSMNDGPEMGLTAGEVLWKLRSTLRGEIIDRVHFSLEPSEEADD